MSQKTDKQELRVYIEPHNVALVDTLLAGAPGMSKQALMTAVLNSAIDAIRKGGGELRIPICFNLDCTRRSNIPTGELPADCPFCSLGQNGVKSAVSRKSVKRAN